MPRLFLAVDLTDEARAVVAPLLGAFPGPRWARPDHLHATLRFLGSLPEEQVPELRRRLKEVPAPPAFALSLSGIGVFPPRPSRRSPPRVLWVGLTPLDPLAALKRAIDQVLGPDPESEERGFHPHVTLARWKQPPGPELAPFLERHALLTCVPFVVPHFRLYESRTLPEGAAYTAVDTFPLGRAREGQGA